MGVNMARGDAQTQQARYVAEAGINHALWLTNSSNCTAYPGPLTANFGAHAYTVNVTPTSGSPVSLTSTSTLFDSTSRSLSRNNISIFQTPEPPLILQPGTEGIDTYVINRVGNDEHNNYGNDTQMRIGTGDAHPLIKFDLSSIPTNARIIEVQLALHFEQADNISAAQMSVHRLTQPWAEEQATWNIYKTGTSWATLGGDYDSNVTAITTVSNVNNTWFSWNITELMSDWVSGAFTNHGLLLRVANGNVINARFTSSDGAVSSNHPKLTITYACECGKSCAATAPPSCDADYLADTKISEFDTAVYGSDGQKDLDYVPEGVTLFGVTIPAGGAWVSVDATDNDFYLNDLSGALLASSPGSSGIVGVAYVSSGIWAGHLAVVDVNTDDVGYYDINGVVVNSFDITKTGTLVPSGATFIDVTASGSYDSHLAITDGPLKELYLIDQAGQLRATLDLSAFTTDPTDVAHIPNSDKLLILDAAQKVYIVTLDGTKTGEYDVSAFGTSSTEGLAINPLTCDHVIGDDGADKVIVLNVSGSPPEPGTTVSLLPMQDTFVGTDDTSVYGGNASAFLGFSSKEWRTLLQFDVSTIPAGSTITSANLRFYNWDNGNPAAGALTVSAHRITEEWTANWANKGANWYDRKKQGGGALQWAGQGGTYDTGWSATTSFNSTSAPQWVEWNITPLAQEWLDGVNPNFGVELVPAAGSAFASLHSVDFGDTTLRPQLLITYE